VEAEIPERLLILILMAPVSTQSCGAASGLDFDGTDDFIDLGNMLPAAGSYTKEMWVYARASACNNLLSSNDDPLYLNGGQLTAGNGNNYAYVVDPTAFPLNTWTHAAVTYDAATSTMKLYVNGVEVSSGNTAPAFTGGTEYLGRHTGACFFDGQLDEVRVWDVARTQSEIQSGMNCRMPLPQTGLVAWYNFEQGEAYGDNTTILNIVDASGNSNDKPLSNFALTGATSNFSAGAAVSSAASCSPASALNFDGADDYAGISTGVFTTVDDNITLEARVMWDGSTGADQVIANNGHVATNGYGLFLDGSNNDKLSIKLGGVGVLASNYTLTPGEWTHITLVRAAGDWSLYVDGNVQMLSGITSTAPNAVAGVFTIGSNHMGNQGFDGTYDEVRLWNRALCGDEIVKKMSCSLTGMEDSLVALYRFNQGDAGYDNTGVTTLADSSGNGYDMGIFNLGLSGSTSNWIAPAGTYSTSCGAYTPPSFTVVGSSVVCPGDTVTFTTSASGSAYLWSDGSSADSLNISSDDSVFVMVTNPNGCYGTASSDTVVINVSTLNVTAAITQTLVCAGVNDTVMAAGAVTYLWDFGAVGDTVVINPTTDSTLVVVGITADGCSDTASVMVSVVAYPTASIAGMMMICSGTNDTLVATADQTVTFMWNGGSVDDTLIVNPTSMSHYTVTATNATGCSDNATIMVDVTALPIISAYATNDSICGGLTDTLVASANETVTFMWDNGTSADSIFVSPTSNTVYTVTATNGTTGCVSSATATISTVDFPSLNVYAVADSFCLGKIDTLVAESDQSVTFEWGNGEMTDTIYVSPVADSTFYVYVVNSFGCGVTTSFFVDAIDCTLGMDDINSAVVSIYPNPNTGIFTVSLNNTTAVIEIYNNLGQVISKQNAKGVTTQFDLSGYSAGVYSVRISDASGLIYQSRLVKE
jgi:hypothetical protein